MIKDSMIPLVVGVTGHRNLVENDLPLLTSMVATELKNLRSTCPDAPALLLSSLAEGADQLCARAALEAGWEISAVLPFALEEYEKDFEGSALTEFRSLISECRDVLVMEETQPSLQDESVIADSSSSKRDQRYLQAGQYVADHCHVLLALWDGSSGVPDGCGTSEVAEYMMRKKAPVLQIATRRAGDSRNDRHLTYETIRHGEFDALENILRRTNTFDRDIQAVAERDASLGISSFDNPSDPLTHRINAVYTAADQMSIKNAVKHNRTIASLAVVATVLTMAFLLYDEAYLSWMILVCLFLLGALFLISRVSAHLGSHQRYMEYRVLAESLRVQNYLHTAGLKTEVASILPWSIRQDLPWIRSALAVMTIGKASDKPVSIRIIWITDQMNYHKRALQRTVAKSKRNDHIVLIALICMIFTYIITAVFEISCGGMLSGRPTLSPDHLDFWRVVLKILMGTLSAATLFTSNYYGSLSLKEMAADHRRMIELYAHAEEKILARGEDPMLLIDLAREELGENSRWFAYQSMNKPGVAL